MMYHPTLWTSNFIISDKQDYSVAAYTPYDCFTLSQHAIIKAKNIVTGPYQTDWQIICFQA